jgi:aminoglycoside phosphotransferase (APT) family kinase protein
MTEITREFLESYLQEKWGETARVEAVERLPRGISRETWLVQARRGANLPAEPLALRRDLDGNSIGTKPLRFEYDVYQRLQGSRVPVAEVLWWEGEDSPWVRDGRAFYMRRLVDGDWDIPNYADPDPRFDALRVEIGREHVRKLALVHGCDWRAQGFTDILSVPTNEADCAPAAIARAYDDLAAFQFAPLPVLTEVREWLLDNAPDAPRICLLKGTNGRGEEIFRDKVIVAMSDWEQCSLGDPASDFSRNQEFIRDIEIDGAKVWGLDQALDYYAELTGMRVSQRSVAYYRILSMVENIITLHHAALPIATGENLSVRLSWLATEAIHGGQKMMLAAASGRMPGAEVGAEAQTVEGGVL